MKSIPILGLPRELMDPVAEAEHLNYAPSELGHVDPVHAPEQRRREGVVLRSPVGGQLKGREHQNKGIKQNEAQSVRQGPAPRTDAPSVDLRGVGVCCSVLAVKSKATVVLGASDSPYSSRACARAESPGKRSRGSESGLGAAGCS